MGCCNRFLVDQAGITLGTEHCAIYSVQLDRLLVSAVGEVMTIRCRLGQSILLTPS